MCSRYVGAGVFCVGAGVFVGWGCVCVCVGGWVRMGAGRCIQLTGDVWRD